MSGLVAWGSLAPRTCSSNQTTLYCVRLGKINLQNALDFGLAYGALLHFVGTHVTQTDVTTGDQCDFAFALAAHDAQCFIFQLKRVCTSESLIVEAKPRFTTDLLVCTSLEGMRLLRHCYRRKFEQRRHQSQSNCCREMSVVKNCIQHIPVSDRCGLFRRDLISFHQNDQVWIVFVGGYLNRSLSFCCKRWRSAQSKLHNGPTILRG